MTDLVDRLAERITTAASRARLSGEDRFVTVCLPAAADADPLTLLAARPTDDAVYWEQPELRLSIAGIGACHRVEPAPDGSRFASAAAEVRSLRARTDQIALEGAERRLVLVGGFSFAAEPDWEGFPSGRLTFPELMLIREPSGATWVAAARVDEHADPGRLAAELVLRLEAAAREAISPTLPADSDVGAAAALDLRDPSYLKTVAAGLESIGAGQLSKVVVARPLAVDHVPDLPTFLATLRDRYTSCATFAMRHDGRTFCGATPERLVRVDGVSISTAAVAGTAARGADAAQDQVIADRLLHDPKERAEHQFVIDEIRRRLATARVTIDPQAATRVMRLPGIQHLSTPMGGTAPVGTTVLDMVGALHPTPAVAGVPGPEAEQWIRDHEPFARGWYTGPVGWCDLAGNGEFRVGLRSGLVDRDRTTLYAGAGIVDGSVPERELEETGLKLGALLGPLLGS